MSRIILNTKTWLLFVLLFGISFSAWAQSDDFNTWTKFKVNHKIDSRFSVSGDLELRMKDDVSKLDRWGLTVGIIKSTFYEAAANRFISDQLSFENTQVLDKKISYEHKEVRVVLIGPEVPDASISIARSKMKEYKLEDTKLVVLQGMNNEAVDVTSIRAMVMEDFYKNSEQRLQQQAVKISQLETTLEQYRTYDAMSRTLVPELKVLYPSITTLSIAHSLEVRVDSMKTDTVTLAVLKFDRHPSAAEKQKISEWLKARVGAKKLRLITE